jgi:hypothetical protein
MNKLLALALLGFVLLAVAGEQPCRVIFTCSLLAGWQDFQSDTTFAAE